MTDCLTDKLMIQLYDKNDSGGINTSFYFLSGGHFELANDTSH